MFFDFVFGGFDGGGVGAEAVRFEKGNVGFVEWGWWCFVVLLLEKDSCVRGTSGKLYRVLICVYPWATFEATFERR